MELETEHLGNEGTPSAPGLICSAYTSSSVLDPRATSLVDCGDLATIVSSRGSLSDEQKYQILTSKPTTLKKYPKNSQKRCFQPKWTENYP